jgi:hypothetical protein
VTTWVPRLKLATAVAAAAVVAAGSTGITAPPAHALPPIPHPPVHPPPTRPPIHEIPRPAPEVGGALDGIPEVRPSNDPYQYELPDVDVPPGAVPRGAQQPSDDGDSDESFGEVPSYRGGGSPGTGTAPAGPYVYDDDDGDGGLDLKTMGLIGAGLVSLTSLGMWLIRKP